MTDEKKTVDTPPHAAGHTTPQANGSVSPRLPHERDESSDSQTSPPRAVIQQAQRVLLAPGNRFEQGLKLALVAFGQAFGMAEWRTVLARVHAPDDNASGCFPASGRSALTGKKRGGRSAAAQSLLRGLCRRFPGRDKAARH